MKNRIKFKISSDDNCHYRDLKARIKQITENLPKKREINKGRLIILLPILFFGVYVFAILFRNNILVYFILYSLLGITSVLIFMNVIHDAVHDNIFRKRWANNILILFFDLIGGNSFIWKKRHMLLHHNFQNISGWDSDIEQAGLIKIYPHSRTLNINKYQHLDKKSKSYNKYVFVDGIKNLIGYTYKKKSI